MRNTESQIQAIKNALNVTGIYSIKNLVSGGLYVGSGVSIGIRWKHHLKLLKSGSHFNPHLQSAWNLYGAETFELGIIEVTSRNLLIEKEQFYLDTLRPSYNIGATATAPFLGKKMSESQKKKISLSLKGRKKTEEHAKNISLGKKGRTTLSEEQKHLLAGFRVKTWKVTMPDGNQIIVKNLNRFCKENGLAQACMGRVAHGERKHHKGWRCKLV